MRIRNKDLYENCLNDFDADTLEVCKCYYFSTLWMHLMEARLEKSESLRSIVSPTMEEVSAIIPVSGSALRLAFITVSDVWWFGDEFSECIDLVFPSQKICGI
ncbi:MAG: hypothetical protein WCG01_00865 [bacterium]